MSDFSAKTIRALSRKGIRLVGLQGEGYVMDDNGTCRVWTFRAVLEAAK